MRCDLWPTGLTTCWLESYNLSPCLGAVNLQSHLASHALSDGALHEAAEAGQHVDGWIHLPVVQLAINVDLQAKTQATQMHSQRQHQTPGGGGTPDVVQLSIYVDVQAGRTNKNTPTGESTPGKICGRKRANRRYSCVWCMAHTSQKSARCITPSKTHLSLCNVPREIRDGVCDVVVGHGQNGQLRD